MRGGSKRFDLGYTGVLATMMAYEVCLRASERNILMGKNIRNGLWRGSFGHWEAAGGVAIDLDLYL